MILFQNDNGKQEIYKLLGYDHTNNYKYLGTQIDQALNGGINLSKINKESVILKIKWGGVLKATNLNFKKTIFK